VQINKAKKSIRDANTNIKALSTGSIDVYNQVNVLIGDDKWMSVREIASSEIDNKVPSLIEEEVDKSLSDIIDISPEDIENLKELADFIKNDDSGVAEIIDTLSDHEERIDKLEQQTHSIMVMSEDGYNSLSPKDENTLYFIYEE
jgi:hypothetical protein